MARKVLEELDKQKIIQLYNSGLTNGREISRVINKPYHSVYRFMKMNNLQMTIKKLSEKEEEQVIKLYNDGMTIEEIHENYFKEKISSGGINYILRQNGVTRRTGQKSQLKNHDFFENIDTEEKAYWLGFLYADGSVRHNKEKGESYSIRLELKKDDKYIIEEFVKSIGLNKQVKEYKDKNPRFKGYDTIKHNAYIAFNSTKMFKDLESWGVVQNKTFKIKRLPTIPKELMNHFIRGYFDGDGSVYENSASGNLRVSIYGTYDFVSDILNFLNKEIGVPLTKVTKQKSANVSFMNISKKDSVYDFYNYIYKDATVFLKRKKEKFESNENILKAS